MSEGRTASRRDMLVLSLFPGIGLLDMAFEEEGFCVVRGPDLLWGGDIRRFHPPAEKFDGVIGGPPCQLFSPLKRLVPNAGERHGNQIPEFKRVVHETQPTWWVMENARPSPVPHVPGYMTNSQLLNNRWLGEAQERTRRFTFGTRDGRSLMIQYAALESLDYRQAVTSSLRAVPVALGPNGKVKRTYSADGKRHGPDRGRRASIAEMCVYQGLSPEHFGLDCPFTETAKRQVIGNGVPLPMGRAIARAVKRALEQGRSARSPSGATEGR
ncbi:MAG: DNA cytosine methyltransferase [Vicinamibacterales bacterium]